MEIKKLTLYTNQLKKQIHFYTQVLGFSIHQQGKGFVEINTGESILRFETRENSTPYHFAFNIPSNQIQAAADWIEKRSKILTNNGIKVIPFDFWNAEAVYFYDVDDNIVEFIARKNLKQESHQPFSHKSILNISEIGMSVDDIQPIFNHLHTALSLNIHSGSVARFCAVGSENGLFIIINKRIKKTWFPTNDFPFSSDFSVTIKNKNKHYKLRFSNQNLYSHELKSSHHSFAKLAESC